MIFSAERSKLLDTVSKMQRIVGTKTSMPILEGVLISAESGRITLIAYNLEMGMKKELYAKCDEPGDIVINARLLADILRRMNGLQVEIECDDKLTCHIRSGEATFDIMGMAATDFPEIPTVNEGESISLNGQILSDMIKTTIFSAAQNEGMKPILMGVNFSTEQNQLRLVAIDGYRLAVRTEQVEPVKDVNFTLSNKAVAEVLKLIDEQTENVEISIASRLISFQCDGYSFITRLMDGEFVNWQKTIPNEHKQKIFVKTQELTEITERVSLLISEVFSTPIRCYFNELNAVFTSATTVGRATETFHTELEGEAFEIGLNSRYLLDVLHAIDTEEIEIRFNGPNAGVLLLPKEGDRFLYMIMPMRLK